MRIGFDAKRVFHNRSGLGNYSRDIIRMLAHYYPQHEYYLYNPKAGKVNFDAGDKSRVILPSGLFSKIFSSAWRRKWISRQLKEDHLSIFHGLSNELPAGISQTGIPAVVSIHDLIFYKYPQWYKAADRIIHQRKVKQAAAEAKHIIAISEQTKKDILEYIAVAPEKISVVYQGCHPAFKQSYTENELQSTRKKFKLPESFVLSVGTIEPRKNLLTTVKSLLHHHLPLVMVGKKTSYYKEVEQFIVANKLENRIFHLADINMTELAMVYQLAFVFCYPSIYEGFGIPVIEALYSGTPVITNREGCFPEAGGAGSFYIDCFDAEAMADIIRQLQNDELLYEATVEKGRSHTAKFNDDVIARSMMDIYMQVLPH